MNCFRKTGFVKETEHQNETAEPMKPDDFLAAAAAVPTTTKREDRKISDWLQTWFSL